MSYVTPSGLYARRKHGTYLVIFFLHLYLFYSQFFLTSSSFMWESTYSSPPFPKGLSHSKWIYQKLQVNYTKIPRDLEDSTGSTKSAVWSAQHPHPGTPCLPPRLLARQFQRHGSTRIVFEKLLACKKSNWSQHFAQGQRGQAGPWNNLLGTMGHIYT